MPEPTSSSVAGAAAAYNAINGTALAAAAATATVNRKRRHCHGVWIFKY